MDDLTAFLNARLDEDEVRAQAAAEEWDDESVRYEWEDLPDAVFAYARNHDPARVLREVEAKRAIIDTWEGWPGYDLPPGVHDGRDDSERSRDEATREALEAVVQALSVVWSDHPDYRPEWKP